MEHPLCNNLLINHLHQQSHDVLLNACEWVSLDTNAILKATSYVTGDAYFPCGAIIVLQMHQPPMKSLALGLIGEEGVFGVASILGVEEFTYEAIVQTEGWALKIPNVALHKLMLSNPNLNTLLVNYIGVIHAQMAQSVVCHHFHFLPQRLARLLLMLQDRLHSPNFFITQDVLSNLLGVRRVGVTKAASVLQQKNILSYRRGHMEIINRLALERIVCPCYALDHQSYQRLN